MRSSILFLLVTKLDNFKEKEGVDQTTASLSIVGSRERQVILRERERERERVRWVKCECGKGEG